jgi:hypothetical protein
MKNGKELNHHHCCEENEWNPLESVAGIGNVRALSAFITQ